MYLRKISPSTTCLYSAASMLLRSLSAAAQSLASKPTMAADWLALSSFALRLVRFAFAALAMDGFPDNQSVIGIKLRCPWPPE